MSAFKEIWLVEKHGEKVWNIGLRQSFLKYEVCPTLEGKKPKVKGQSWARNQKQKGNHEFYVKVQILWFVYD